MRGIVHWLLLLGPFLTQAQMQPPVPPDRLSQLQVPQPKVDVSATVTATTSFDPPTMRVGEKTFYRVRVDATESSIRWPEQIPAPTGLTFGPGTRGQIAGFQGNKFLPMTTFLYEVRASAAGHFSVPNFVVEVYGKPVEIPAANLEVVPPDAAPLPAPRQLVLNVSTTNVFLGQPFRVRVMLPATPTGQIEALREIQFNGNGFMSGKTDVRQTIQLVNQNGQPRPTFICEMTATPIATGPLQLSAQGFTAGREFSGPITISGQVTIPGGQPDYLLLVSDPVGINVRPLPVAGELPGFTGAVGKFAAEPPGLTTNRLRVGEPVELKFSFRAEDDLSRFVPPEPPRSHDWQIIAGQPPNDSFTLIPLTDDAQATPAIPFCAFDPAAGKYVNLTIPSLPVTVIGPGLPAEISAADLADNNSGPTKLSDLAPMPGKTKAGREPLQLRGWFVGVQLAPLIGFLALWHWDRRRRFLEAHPEIVRCRRARRELRREKRKLENAAATGDTDAFVRHAASALRIACAPHFPAHPQALVCADVLTQLDEAEQKGRSGEIVHNLFAAADAQFAIAPQTRGDWLSLKSGVDEVLLKLEERL